MVTVAKRTEGFLFAPDLCIWCYIRHIRFRKRILVKIWYPLQKGGETNREVGKKTGSKC